MTGVCRLNKKNMRNLRRDQVYQCLLVDLTMLGIVSKEECEMLLGSGIPKGLILPNGSAGNLVSEASLPEQGPVVTEPTDTEPTDTEPSDTEPSGTGTIEPAQE